jgi:hypothetical protein
MPNGDQCKLSFDTQSKGQYFVQMEITIKDCDSGFFGHKEYSLQKHCVSDIEYLTRIIRDEGTGFDVVAQASKYIFNGKKALVDYPHRFKG